MKQRGRQSTAAKLLSLAINNERPTLIPSRRLSKEEQSIWNLIVRDHRHLRSIDAPLLSGYVMACAKMLTIKDPEAFEKIARVTMSLATRLRLTPQAGMQPISVARRYTDVVPVGPRPWDRDDED